MADFVYWLFNMSIAGSIGCIIILLLRRIKKVPRRYIRILWLIPIIRFLIPIGVTTKFSLMNLLSGYAVKTIPIKTIPAKEYLAWSNYIQQADEYFPMVYKTDVLEPVFTSVFYVWAIIVSILLVISVLMYLLTWKERKAAVHMEANIYYLDSASTAAVYGIFHPQIILPFNLDETSRSFILKHEIVHIRRGDNLLRCIAILTACIHWFNPLVWIMLKFCLEDIELACDEAVIQTMEPKEQKEYAMTVLKGASPSRIMVTSFGGAKAKVRINNILNYKKITMLSGICFAVFCILIFIILLTNARV